MWHETLKRWGAMLLAFCMVFTAVQFPPRQVKAASPVNLARQGATATASNSEGGTQFTPDKVIDGIKSGGKSDAVRWGTDPNRAPYWLQLAWDQAQTMQHFFIIWQRRNVGHLTVQISDTGADGSWQNVWERTKNCDGLVEEITLDQAQTAKYVRFYMEDIIPADPDGIDNYNNISIFEIEVYNTLSAAEISRRKNIALDAGTAAASATESDSVPAANIKDGDTATRWSHPTKASAWVSLGWSQTQSMQSFRILWERKNANSYYLEASDDGTTWRKITKTLPNPEQVNVEISLTKPVKARHLRLQIADIADRVDSDSEFWPNNPSAAWQAVSVYELEVYSNAGDMAHEDGAQQIDGDLDGLEGALQNISAPELLDGRISMPEILGVSSTRFCADYEQVIGEDGTIAQPLEAKTVKGFYELVIEESGETFKTPEFTVEVPGQFEDDESVNAKPDVIPELQEWHGGNGAFYVGTSSRIVVKNSALSDVAEVFAKDYKDVTGLDISVVDGTSADITVSAGDFCLDFAEESQKLGKEGYMLDIGDAVSIEAEQATGAYWATRTILQIVKQSNGSIPKGLVRDYPKYAVRAFSLDVGRKAFTLDALYDFAKNMSWYKMNSFQVHLSDNLIFHEDYSSMEEAMEKSYAGNRLQSDMKGSTGKTSTAEDVYYTKKEFRTFILDCRVMGVDIVPEFDMPAHALPWTRAFPEYQTQKAGGHGWLIEEVNLSLGEVVDEWAKSVWNEYFEEGIFDEEMTVHIGTDEYHGTPGQQGQEEFRRFSAALINFVQSKKRTVRMWGSLTNKSGTTPVPVEGVQLNIWNTGYADPQAMYNMGYGLINTLEGPNYIVPAAGYYNDYINAASIYNTWQPNAIGNLTASAGDDQMLGGCYAIWHDSVDTRGNGISQYDSFDRFFQPLPSYSAKLWGEAEDKNYTKFSQLFAKTGTAPGTQIDGDVESVSSTVVDYKFDADLEKDSSANGYDLTKRQNVGQVAVDGSADHKALKLKGGVSYVETPINQVGSNAVLTMKVKMDEGATGEQILCESKNVCGTYGTYAFKASQKHTGKVGFSREGYDYSFNYTLPAGEWHTLEFHSGKDTVALYVDGRLIDNKHYDDNGELATTRKGNETVVISKDNKPDICFANHETTELSEKLAKHGIIKIATMHVPMGRIGSDSNSFKGEIDSVTVSMTKETSGDYNSLDRTNWDVAACSVHSEGPIRNAIDGNKDTYWHQNYGNDTYLGSGDETHEAHDHWYEVTLPQEEQVASLTYLPRQNNTSGRIYEYSIVVTAAAGTETTVVSHGEWADDITLKTATFSPVMAKKVKLLIHRSGGSHATIAELNLYGEISPESCKAELKQYITGCGSYQKDDYGEMVWGKYETALARAQKLADSESGIANDYIFALEQLERAVEDLKTSTDRRLAALLEEVAQKKAEDYAATGYLAYRAKIDAASGLGEDAGESAKIASAKAIEQAARALVYIGALRKAVASAEEKDGNDYEANDGWTAFQTKIDEAKTLLGNANATQDAVNQAIGALADAEGKLTPNQKKVQEEALTAAVAAAEDLLAGIDASEYTEESVNALKTAIEKAKKELSSAEATASSLEAIRKALASARPETPAYAAKREALQGAVSSANTLAANINYTAESLQALKQAIAKAVEAIQNGAAEDELQTLLTGIQTAQGKLEFITCTVTFDSDGGTAVKAQSVKIGTKATKPADPARSGYTFQGWSETKGGKAVSWPLAVTGNTKLYALWKKNEQPQQPQPKFEDGATMTDPKTKISYKVASAAKKTAVVTGTDDKTAAKVAIPESVVICGTKCKVVTVGKTAFKNCKKLTGVTVGKNVTSIEQNAFLGCRKLKKVMVKGKKLTAVKPGAFKNTAKNLIVKVPKGMKKTQKNKLIKAMKKCGNKNAKVK